jgi:hypothetical protein
MTNICFICKDYEEELYKICECMDSTLCHNCLLLSDRRNIVNCPICRKLLKKTTSRDKTKTLFLFLKFMFLNLGLLFIPLICPIHSLINKVSDLSIVYFIVTLFSIIILEPSILKYTTQFLNIKHSKYIITKLLSLIIFVGFSFLINIKKRDEFHLIIVILPLFIAPGMIISLFLIMNNITKIIHYINEKTIVKHMIFYKINNT